jgi:hypothetical protein
MFSLLITFISGMGGYSDQVIDYYKHNLIIKDLTLHEWPVLYKNNGKNSDFLCYNLAYYLPFSLMAKISGDYFHWVDIVKVSGFIWSWFGLLLVYSWILRLVNKRYILSILMFTVLGNLESMHIIWSYMSQQLELNVILEIPDQSVIINNYRLLLPNNINHIIWAPQHAIGGWLVTALLYWHLRNQLVQNIFFIHSLSVFWSIFIFIGLLPITLFCILTYYRKEIFNFQNIIGAGFLTLLFFFFYNSHYSLEYIDFIFTSPFHAEHILSYLFFIFIEIWFFGLFLFYYNSEIYFLKLNKKFILFMLIFLSVLSLFIIGRYNDLIMRASIPAMFIISVFLIKLIANLKKNNKNLHYYVFVVTLFIGFIIPVKEIIRITVNSIHKSNSDYSPLDVYSCPDKYNISKIDKFYEDMFRYQTDFNLSKQYLGKDSTIFYEYIMKHKSESNY